MDKSAEEQSDQNPIAQASRYIRTIEAIAEFFKNQPRAIRAIGMLATAVAVNGWLFKRLLDLAHEHERLYVVAAAPLIIGVVCFVLLVRRSRLGRNKRQLLASAALKGLSFYSESKKDGEYFKKLGRQSEVDQIISYLDSANTLVVVLGPSGSGKTSLLRAGVHYRLQGASQDGIEAGKSIPSIYFAATEKEPAAVLARSIEMITDVDCSENFTALLGAEKGQLIVLIDQLERLDRKNPDHAPIFELIQQVADRSKTHSLQMVVALSSSYLAEWMDFLDDSKIHPLKVKVLPFRPGMAADIMETILSDAGVACGRSVIERYVQDIAEDGRVSPVGIAIGAVRFSEWDETDDALLISEYETSGGAIGVLTTHFNECLGPDNVRPGDRDPFVRALMQTLVSGNKGRRKTDGQPAEAIAASAGIELHRVRNYLQALEDGRILEVDPASHYYFLSHDLLVTALSALASKVTIREKRVLDLYELWKVKKQRRHLLRRRQLSWALTNKNSFLIGPEAPGKHMFLYESYRARNQKLYSAPILLMVLLAALYGLWHLIDVSRTHEELARFHLPSDLYEHQKGLQSLTIEQPGVTSVDWLESSELLDLTIKCSNLESLEGLRGADNLRSLDIDLAGTPISSLKQLTHLKKLQILTLHNMARGPGKGSLIPDLNGLRELTELDLDFHESNIVALPDLTQLLKLRKLKLNLRLTGVSDISELAKLPQLSALTLLLEGSGVNDLKPLASLNNLNMLELGLSEPQVQHLRDLSGNQSKLSLMLRLSEAQELPDLGLVRNLEELELVVNSQSAHLPALDQFKHLHHLTMSLTSPKVSSLPSLDQLKELESFELKLRSTQLSSFPTLPPMDGLELLVLDLSGTTIQGLPKLLYGRNIKDLSLVLNHEESGFARGIDQIEGLQALTLDLRQPNRADADMIVRLPRLEKLVLLLRWYQVNDLPGLTNITNLHSLELELDGYATVENLPDLSHLVALRDLSLHLDRARNVDALPNLGGLRELSKLELRAENASLHDLSALSGLKSLQVLALHLRGSAIESLPDLNQLEQLNKIILDISHTQIKDLSQLKRLPHLQDVTLDQDVRSLKDLPKTVTVLRFVP
jgi:hypothetical protein